MRLVSFFFALCFSFSAFANVTKPTINLENLALQKNYLQNIDCRAPKAITSMLNHALKNTDNYAAKANHASVIEELMVKNPPCFIQALNQLPNKSCLQFKEHFIEETFFYPRDDIKTALAGAKNYHKSCIAS